jgi:hypothetical protein
MMKAVGIRQFLDALRRSVAEDVLTQAPRIFEECHASFLIDKDGAEFIARVLFGAQRFGVDHSHTLARSHGQAGRILGS